MTTHLDIARATVDITDSATNMSRSGDSFNLTFVNTRNANHHPTIGVTRQLTKDMIRSVMQELHSHIGLQDMGYRGR